MQHPVYCGTPVCPAILILLAVASAHAQMSPSSGQEPLHPVRIAVPEPFAEFYQEFDSLNLPRDFTVSVFAAGLQRPRFMAWSPEGVLHVADMQARAVLALPDENDDGIADTVLTAVSGIDSAHSLAFHDGALYVPEPDRVRRFRDQDGDGFYETEETVVEGIDATGPYNHYTRTILIDEESEQFYLGVGASCNACREEHSERASIMRFNVDGSGRTVYASGLRNPTGLAFAPDGALWATNADRDKLGPEVPREIVTKVEEGSFYGWPFAYGDHQWVDFQADADYSQLLPLTRSDSELVAGMRTAEVYLPAHSTPLGIQFYTDSGFPERYRGGAFAALHGSAPGTRPEASGYKVVYLRQDEETMQWNAEDFLTGFLIDPTVPSYHGRPCGILTDTRGNLYVSSDRGLGAIYRISYAPSPLPPQPPVRLNLTAYPNPLQDNAGSGLLIINIPAPGTVTIDLFDALGRRVERLADGRRPDALRTSIAWPGSLNLPAGIYYMYMHYISDNGRSDTAETTAVLLNP